MEQELDSEIGLRVAGYVEIARETWAKGKRIFARCEDCGHINELPFTAIGKQSRLVIITCPNCVNDGEPRYKAGRALLKTKW